MRANIDLDDDLIRRARQVSRAKTKKALIEEALQTLISVESARRQRQTYAERLQDLQAKLTTLDLQQRPSELLRQDRSR